MKTQTSVIFVLFVLFCLDLHCKCLALSWSLISANMKPVDVLCLAAHLAARRQVSTTMRLINSTYFTTWSPDQLTLLHLISSPRLSFLFWSDLVTNSGHAPPIHKNLSATWSRHLSFTLYYHLASPSLIKSDHPTLINQTRPVPICSKPFWSVDQQRSFWFIFSDQVKAQIIIIK